MYGVKINNVSEWAKDKKYLVARVCDCKLWYWGATDDEEKARAMAKVLENSIIVYNKE